MSYNPPLSSSSWVDLSKELSGSSSSPPIPFGSDSDYMRMLKEAQKVTSCRTSARVSPITSAFMSQNSTRRNSSTPSPTSPSDSPHAELVDLAEYQEALGEIYINRIKEPEIIMSDFMWDWSSRPNILPPKDWKIQHHHTKSSRGSICYKPKPPRYGYSKKVVFSMVLTNILSMIIGVGIGIWIFRKRGAQNIKIFMMQ